MACIICGESDPEKINTIELPHGKVELCYGDTCRRMLTGKVIGYYPIAGFNFGEIFDAEHFEEREDYLDTLTDEDEEQLSSDVADLFWNDDSVGGHFNECVNQAAIYAEQMVLRKTPAADLPLRIGDLEFKENEKFLEKLIKEKAK